MCEYCFEKEINSFENYKDFEKFELLLAQKLNKNIDYNGELEAQKYDILAPTYKCKSCKTVWVLSHPDNSWRGFLLRSDEAKEYHIKIKKRSIRLRYIYLLIGFIILFLLIILNTLTS